MSKPSKTKVIEITKEEIEELIFQHLAQKGYALQGKIKFETELDDDRIDNEIFWSRDPVIAFNGAKATVLD